MSTSAGQLFQGYDNSVERDARNLLSPQYTFCMSWINHNQPRSLVMSTAAEAGGGNSSFNVMQMYTLHGGALELVQEKSLTGYLVSVNLNILTKIKQFHPV